MKNFWQSKTFWFNILATAGALFDQSGALGYVLSPEETVTVMGVGNLFLRLLTSKGIVK